MHLKNVGTQIAKFYVVAWIPTTRWTLGTFEFSGTNNVLRS